MERIKSKENNVKLVMEQKFSQIDGITGSVEDNCGKVKETLLDILNNDVGKTEIVPRKPWITEAMIKKMEERTIAKTTYSKSIESSIINGEEKLTELKKYICKRYARNSWTFRRKADMIACIKGHNNRRKN